MAKNPLLSMRLPPDLLRRVDVAVAGFRTAHPGVTFTRADAIKEVLARHLPADPEASPVPELPTAAPARTPTKASAKPRAKSGRRRS